MWIEGIVYFICEWKMHKGYNKILELRPPLRFMLLTDNWEFRNWRRTGRSPHSVSCPLWRGACLALVMSWVQGDLGTRPDGVHSKGKTVLGWWCRSRHVHQRRGLSTLRNDHVVEVSNLVFAGNHKLENAPSCGHWNYIDHFKLNLITVYIINYVRSH